MSISNYDILKTSFHTKSNMKKLETTLKTKGIDCAKLPANVLSNLGYATKVMLEKKDKSGLYPFTGVVAMLGEKNTGQLLVPANRNVSNMFVIGNMDVFNPNALKAGKPVIVLTDFAATLQLLACGVNAVSVGSANPCKYLIPLAKQVLTEGNTIPKVYYHLPLGRGGAMVKEFNALYVPCIDIIEELNAGFDMPDFSSFQKFMIRSVISSISTSSHEKCST